MLHLRHLSIPMPACPWNPVGLGQERVRSGNTGCLKLWSKIPRLKHSAVTCYWLFLIHIENVLDANTHNSCAAVALETTPLGGVGARQSPSAVDRVACQRVPVVAFKAASRLPKIQRDLVGAASGCTDNRLLLEHRASVPLHPSWLPAPLDRAAAPARAHH